MKKSVKKATKKPPAKKATASGATAKPAKTAAKRTKQTAMKPVKRTAAKATTEKGPTKKAAEEASGAARCCGERFQEHREACEAKLAALRAGLDRLAAEQGKSPGDWGFVGSAGHLDELLGEALEFLGGGTCDRCGANTVFDDARR